jgi:hypothetical protein
LSVHPTPPWHYFFPPGEIQELDVQSMHNLEAKSPSHRFFMFGPTHIGFLQQIDAKKHQPTQETQTPKTPCFQN